MSIDVANDHLSIQQDLELSGGLNRSVTQGAKFSLLLAMLEDDLLKRPSYFEKKDELTDTTLDLQNYYRRTPLKASEQDWLNAEVEAQLLQQNSQDIFLWRALHPQPLSVFDDSKRIDDEVKANCGFATQQRFSATPSTEIPVDPTLLYDVLQQAQETF